MDLYLADYTFAPVKLIDNYESFVWTDRFSANGDFTLVVPLSYYLQNLRFAEYIVASDSLSVMMVETVERTKDEADGAPLVKVTGRDFSAFLQNRSNKSNNTVQAKTNETFTGTVSDIIRFIIFKYVVDPTLAGAVNAISGFTVVNAVAPQGASTTITVARDTVYNMVKTLCDAAGYGFSVRRNLTSSGLTCFILQGTDRTDPNSGIYRVYGPDDDTLYDTHSIESIANYKNHARVLGAKTGIDVFLPNLPTPTGIDRRTVVIEAADVGPDSTTTVAQDQAVLSRRGLEALANQQNSYIYVVDGKIPQNQWNSTYFGLGDVVYVKDETGSKTKSRITEQIWSADANGQQMNPTFTAV